jgi:FeS assembly SUF system regulator
MLRISKLTDYATVALASLAQEPARLHTVSELAERTQVSAPTVSKVMKQLQRAGIVTSSRGQHGGYQLARPASAISAAAILDALEGPVALTDCAAGQGHCDIEGSCHVGTAWQRVNLAIRRSLHEVSLAQLAGLDAAPVRISALERELRPAAIVRGAAAARGNGTVP